MAKNELRELRRAMARHGIDAYVIKVGDGHGSEYTPDAFRALEYISGFSGSNGLLIVTADDAGLWTDSRYFIQADEELRAGITLYKQGVTGVITPNEFLQSLPDDATIGLDGRMFSHSQVTSFKRPVLSIDLISEIWEDRPAIRVNPIRVFKANDDRIKVARSNLKSIRASMKKSGADFLIIQTLDDIAWTLGLRGSDIPYVPVFYSYLLINKKKAWLFAYDSAISLDVKNHLEDLKVDTNSYENFYEALPEILGDKPTVMLNPANISYELFKLVEAHGHVAIAPEPTISMKAEKTKEEIKCFEDASVLDGVAMCKFLYWIKNYFKENDSKEPLTEISAARKLHDIRSKLGAMGESFETISAYAEHGAIVHYSATEESNATIKPEGFLLVDSGAHYEHVIVDAGGDSLNATGTTDITRTIAMGPLSEEEKLHYTLVLMGHIDYVMATFPRGTPLSKIDGLAHNHLRAHGLDYYHGTSHGIGNVLSVHESLGSAGINNALREGMILSDEPGVYIEGSHGIRIEGDILCVKKTGERCMGGEGALGFEMLTLCPYERGAIDASLMSKEQLGWLNQYHERVRKKIAPHLEGEELEWLISATKKI